MNTMSDARAEIGLPQAVLEESIHKVQVRFSDGGDAEALARNSKGKCLDGCVGLIYCLLNSGKADLYELIFLLHGYRDPNAAFIRGFEHHFIVAAKAREGIWFSVSPSNYHPEESWNFGEMFVASNPSDLYMGIVEQYGGRWFPPHLITIGNRYCKPQILNSSSQEMPFLEATIGEWDPEGLFTKYIGHPVKLFGKLS